MKNSFRFQQNEILLHNNQKSNPCSFVIQNYKGNLDFCQGSIQGMWTDKTSTYILKPFSNVSLDLLSPHLIIKYQWKIDNSWKSRMVKIQEQKSRLLENHLRNRIGKMFDLSHLNVMKNFFDSILKPNEIREKEDILYENAEKNVTIEMAIFVDKSLYSSLKSTFPENTDNHVIRDVTKMRNLVQICYLD